MLVKLLALLGAVHTATAHFSVTYPYWRGDSFSTQWEHPCGGVNQTAESEANRTQWPVDGGSLIFQAHHPWAYTFVSLGLGNETTNYNITLVEIFNQTGNGTVCFPKLTLPEGTPVSQGTKGSIQVVQVNEHGSALYNCADIIFSSNVTVLSSDQCQNSTGIGGAYLTEVSSTSAAANTTTSSTASSTSSKTNGAASMFKSSAGLALLVGGAVALSF